MTDFLFLACARHVGRLYCFYVQTRPFIISINATLLIRKLANKLQLSLAGNSNQPGSTHMGRILLFLRHLFWGVEAREQPY